MLFEQIGTTNAIAATATALTRALPNTCNTAVVCNDGSSIVFVAFGGSTITATLPGVSTNLGAEGSSIPIISGNSIPLKIPAGSTHWSVICPATGTATVYLTAGEGV